eukprot:CAMPEP_0194187560 /NCGR_PEP_ID=MMETSP0154-20130528/51444_1 /TAXON_ID=1049557 /ORGANISM="Thalassiothrix antarctica, Strain L6-D1" /LENGTH=104 /DNA_ID=CAMNT_0038907375 /DNA_START=39 /DNA_END=350 /DNA_ORIENTATION=+
MFPSSSGRNNDEIMEIFGDIESSHSGNSSYYPSSSSDSTSSEYEEEESFQNYAEKNNSRMEYNQDNANEIEKIYSMCDLSRSIATKSTLMSQQQQQQREGGEEG